MMNDVTHKEYMGLDFNNLFVARFAHLMRYVLAAAFLCIALPGLAQTTLIPPNDVSGHVFSTNSNDGWGTSRGVVFQVDTTTSINMVGLYQDLTGVTINYEIAQVTSASANLATGKTVLRSGNMVATTTGLEYVNFSFAPVALTAGNFYHIRFWFNGTSNQNFFYDNQNLPFTQAGFSVIDGTRAEDTDNTVMPRIQLGIMAAAATAVPVPMASNLVLMAMAALLLALGATLLRRAPH